MSSYAIHTQRWQTFSDLNYIIYYIFFCSQVLQFLPRGNKWMSCLTEVVYEGAKLGNGPTTSTQNGSDGDDDHNNNKLNNKIRLSR